MQYVYSVEYQIICAIAITPIDLQILQFKKRHEYQEPYN